jgi:hypothetical protein
MTAVNDPRWIIARLSDARHGIFRSLARRRVNAAAGKAFMSETMQPAAAP